MNAVYGVGLLVLVVVLAALVVLYRERAKKRETKSFQIRYDLLVPELIPGKIYTLTVDGKTFDVLFNKLDDPFSPTTVFVTLSGNRHSTIPYSWFHGARRKGTTNLNGVPQGNPRNNVVDFERKRDQRRQNQ